MPIFSLPISITKLTFPGMYFCRGIKRCYRTIQMYSQYTQLTWASVKQIFCCISLTNIFVLQIYPWICGADLYNFLDLPRISFNPGLWPRETLSDDQHQHWCYEIVRLEFKRFYNIIFLLFHPVGMCMNINEGNLVNKRHVASPLYW